MLRPISCSDVRCRGWARQPCTVVMGSMTLLLWLVLMWALPLVLVTLLLLQSFQRRKLLLEVRLLLVVLLGHNKANNVAQPSNACCRWYRFYLHDELNRCPHFGSSLPNVHSGVDLHMDTVCIPSLIPFVLKSSCFLLFGWATTLTSPSHLISRVLLFACNSYRWPVQACLSC